MIGSIQILVLNMFVYFI